MKMSTMTMGVSAMAIAGTTMYMMSKASKSDKKMLKSRTGKALHAVGEVADGLSRIMG